MRIRHSITFRLYAYPGGGRYQVRMVTTFGGHRVEFSTGHRFADAGLWDAGRSRFRAAIPDGGKSAAELNRELEAMSSAMEDVFRFYEGNEVVPGRAELTERFRVKVFGVKAPSPAAAVQKKAKAKADAVRGTGRVPGSPASLPRRPTLAQLFPLFVSECGTKNSWTEATHQKMRSLMRDLEAFRPGLRGGDLDEGVLTAFVDYLRNAKVLHTPRKKKGERDPGSTDDTVGLRNSSIHKKLGFLGWFLNWSVSRGYETCMAYRTFRPTLKQTQRKVIYLTREELREVIALDLSASADRYLEPVRDIFLFCCFSGLRYSDAQNLRWADVKDGCIEVTTVKTADTVRVEFNDTTASIAERYRGLRLWGDYVLPRITNQAMNRDLKKLCRKAGVCERVAVVNYRGSERLEEVKEKWELVGTHTGRRTFVVQALSQGIPPNVVMKWTGHSDYKAMRPYIDIVDSIRASEMGKMNFLDGVTR